MRAHVFFALLVLGYRGRYFVSTGSGRRWMLLYTQLLFTSVLHTALTVLWRKLKNFKILFLCSLKCHFWPREKLVLYDQYDQIWLFEYWKCRHIYVLGYGLTEGSNATYKFAWLSLVRFHNPPSFRLRGRWTRDCESDRLSGCAGEQTHFNTRTGIKSWSLCISHLA
jgi:hypothetical protein